MSRSPDAGAGPRPPLLHRAAPRQLQTVDVVLAALLFLLSALHVAAHQATVPGSNARWTVVAWFIAAVSIVLRRRAPAAALALMVVSICAATGSNNQNVSNFLICLPMYQVAATRPRSQSLVALAASLVALLALAGVVGVVDHSGASTAGVVVAVAAWFVGDAVRVRRVYVAGLAEQAAQRQREAIERAQRSVAEERLQIARELHDVVAHSLSVIAVQSGVGRHVIDANPTEAKRALAAVEATSRSALDELRRMLGVLRRDESGPAELAPAPSIAGLSKLVEQVGATGTAVELEISSRHAGSLSPSAELSVYRIVQEALTNVVKHAGPASAHVNLRDDHDALVIEVVDDGRGDGGLTPYPRAHEEPIEPGAAPVGRHGIVGMRERVALFGGTFAAGPRPEGGFRVLARLPLDRVGAA